jgi:peptide-methionine (S)-S-oxide reductase
MKNYLYTIIGLLGLWQGDANAMETTPTQERAIFAGGCFWCMQPVFDHMEGVISTFVGYSGGDVKNPTYEEVSSGTTGHVEANEVVYDPAKVSYEKLLDAYWRNIDPVDANGQFYDRGPQYHTAIFYFTAEQKKLAEASKKKLEAELKQPIRTQILPAKEFYPAEEYHQEYYKKNPIRYNAYKMGSGRKERLKEIWGTAE